MIITEDDKRFSEPLAKRLTGSTLGRLNAWNTDTQEAKDC